MLQNRVYNLGKFKGRKIFGLIALLKSETSARIVYVFVDDIYYKTEVNSSESNEISTSVMS